MDRTLRASLIAGAIGLLFVGGIAWFLGFEVGPSLVAGVVAGVLAALLLLAAARRAATFHAPEDAARPDGDDEATGPDERRTP